jgi:hypothetical protein
MARRRSRRGHRSSRGDGIKSIFGKVIGPLSFGGSFIQQITQKDMQTSSNFSGLTNTQKAQWIGADILYRITGMNLAPGVLQNPGTWGLNPKGVLNKWTGTGIALTAYSALAPKKFPFKPLAKKIGMGTLAGGIAGGFFDNPPSAPPGGGYANNIGSLNSNYNSSSNTGLSTGAIR